MSARNKSLFSGQELRLSPLTMIILICLILTAIVFNEALKLEGQNIRADFERAAENRFSALEDKKEIFNWELTSFQLKK